MQMNPIGGAKPKTNAKGVPGLALGSVQGGINQPMGMSTGQNFNKAKGTKPKK